MTITAKAWVLAVVIGAAMAIIHVSILVGS